MAVYLGAHQVKAVHEIEPGKIVRGDVGVGKTIIALAYYLIKECNDGEGWGPNYIDDDGRVHLDSLSEEDLPRDLYVITTAKKRDHLDWVKEAALFGIGPEREFSQGNVRLHVDSWNNIGSYAGVHDAFFIFDEQRLVGNGAWVKAFYKIAKANRWIMLSATPADSWMDYIPVFVANGHYTSRAAFVREHVLIDNYSRYPKIRGYNGEAHLRRLEARTLVVVKYERHTTRQVDYLEMPFDKELFDLVWKKRWNAFTNEPVKTISELFYLLRRVVNSHPHRLATVREIVERHPRLIIFYNFTYELEILRQLADVVPVSEWNGKKHDPVPDGERWVYLVQYTAGSEGWNCVSTDATLFYSLTYSYRAFEQSQGRIDRLNTPYKMLYYYVLKSSSFIDKAILTALREKRNFNVKKFVAKSEISAHF